MLEMMPFYEFKDWSILTTHGRGSASVEKLARLEHFVHQKHFDDMDKKKVMLVDDNVSVRAGVRRMFNAHPNFTVCGEASHGREAIEKAPSLRPDLILLDLSMPEMNGLEAAPLLLQILPRVSLILFSAHNGPEVERLSRTAGIHAVVPKSKAATQLIAQAEALVNSHSPTLD